MKKFFDTLCEMIIFTVSFALPFMACEWWDQLTGGPLY